MDENTSTTGSTIGTSIIVFILLIASAIIIYYVVKTELNESFPINSFNPNDRVVIRPAVLSDINNPNEYLSNDPNFRYFNYNTELAGYSYGANGATPISFAATFTGNPQQDNSQWILRLNSVATNTAPSYNANQSITYGYGDRYFMQNAAFDENDPHGRLRYQLLNQIAIGGENGLVYSTTPAVIGASGDETVNDFNNELLLYFFPSQYKDLYYILLPTCWGIADQQTNTTIAPNQGIASIRPWSSNISPLSIGCTFTNNQNSGSPFGTCTQPADAGIYLPYMPPGQCTTPFGTSTLNQNVMILNFLGEGGAANISNLDPNVFLFKITKV
jgi:hypothetical protein